VFTCETANTNFIVLGLTRPGLEPTIYHNSDNNEKSLQHQYGFDKMIFLNI